MKKVFLLLLVLFFFNCEDQVSNKNPVFEATINGNNEWIAQEYYASLENDQLYITGNNLAGTLSIVLESPSVGEYNFHSWTNQFATFQDTIQYSTKNNGIGSIAFLSSGSLDIHEIDNIDNTITGHFHFDAYNASGEHTINISEGVFYKIPITAANLD